MILSLATMQLSMYKVSNIAYYIADDDLWTMHSSYTEKFTICYVHLFINHSLNMCSITINNMQAHNALCIYLGASKFAFQCDLCITQARTQGGLLRVSRNPLLKLMIFIQDVFTEDNGKPWS